MRIRFFPAIVGLLGAVGSNAYPSATPVSAVGFESKSLPDGTEVAIWYPAVGTATNLRQGIYEQQVVIGAAPIGTKLPLVVISHGSGSSSLAHHDTAAALAKAGFVVAAVTHPGDNWRDHSKATDLALRSRTISLAISYMLQDWPQAAKVNPKRIGAFGYSAGGFTVLAAVGAKADLSRIVSHCRLLPQAFECKITGAKAASSPAQQGTPDRRIKALVIAAPALGYTFDREGMRKVTMPVQLWRAANDQIIPAPYYADAVRMTLPRRPEFHDVPGAGHFDFMVPCAPGSPTLPICQTPAFDRAAFHVTFNTAVVRFFTAKL